MKNSILTLATCALSLSIASAVLAQPDPKDAGKADNPPNGKRGGRGGNGPKWRDMTPEQRAEAQKKMRHDMMTMFLDGAGIKDATTQTAILAFADEQDLAREELNKASRDLIRALAAERMGKAPATDAEIALSEVRGH